MKALKKPLRALARRHDLIGVTVTDPRETALPDVGLLELEDAETGDSVVIDTGSRGVRTRYAALARAREAKLNELFNSIGVDHIHLYPSRDYVLDLVNFIRTKMR